MNRRSFLLAAGAATALGAPLVSRAAAGAGPQVVIVGAGYGGATAARYLRRIAGDRIRVTVVEPEERFVSCPMSNLVLEGSLGLPDVTRSYDALQNGCGIRWVRDRATHIDPDRRQLRLAKGEPLDWDRLILAPGIDFMWEDLPGLATPESRQGVLHAWKPGPQILELRRQLEAMPQGGRFLISIPEAPYRCPPAPYERACLAAAYLKRHNPTAKVHIFDANQDVTSKAQLFKDAWADLYPGMVEYFPSFKAVDMQVERNTVIFELGEEERGDVVNFIPPMRAGRIAVDAGLATANDRWCEVDFLSFASVVHDRIHVLGDSVQIAPVMPKSGHMANQHGKTCAAAVAALLLDRPVNDLPMYSNTCYSFVDGDLAAHVASVHRYSGEKKTMLPVEGAGGVSDSASHAEAQLAHSWARAIWEDTLGGVCQAPGFRHYPYL